MSRKENWQEQRYWDEEIETMPRVQLEKLQLQYLQDTLHHAYEHSPYYKRAFDEASVKPEDVRSLTDLSRFPFVNKLTERDTQGVGSFLGEMAAVPEEDVVFISTSSGSTGVPTISPFTKQDFDDFQEVESRFLWQVGMRPTDRHIHALSFSLYVGAPDVIGAQNLGALCIWGGTIPSERMLFVMQSYQPTTIWTSPSYAWYLGETAKKKGLDPAKDLAIRKILVGGEMGGSVPATKEALEKLWDAKVYDMYGMSDIFGACACSCEEQDGLHLAEDHILVETVDPDTGELLKPGEVGELVYTSIRKRARPMIRFRSGDIGYVNTERCRCGRTFTRLYVQGRKDDMFIVSGVNVFPSDIEAVVHEIPDITSEYLIRVIEKDYTCKYIVELEKNSVCGRKDEQLSNEITIALKARIGVKPYQVILHPEGGLKTRSTHKAKRLIDERVTLH